jgi:hypothetical protein
MGPTGKQIMAAAIFGVASAWSPALAQQNHDYWFLTVSDNEMMMEDVDATSITPSNGDVRRAWTWTFHATGAQTDAGSHQVALTEVNCRTWERHSLQVTFYDNRGEVNTYRSESAPEPWSHAVPETFGDAEIQFICADPKRRNYLGLPLPKGMAPEQSAHSFDAQRSFHMPTFAEAVERALHESKASQSSQVAAQPQ